MVTILDDRSARSIKRYTNLIVNQLNAQCIILPNQKFTFFIYLQKYIWLPVKLMVSIDKNILLPSENYAYLLPFIAHKNAIIVCHDLHDLMNRDVPKWRKCFQKATLKFMRFAESIVCISQQTKMDLQKVVGDKLEPKMKVIHNPIEPFWFKKVDRPLHVFDSVEPEFVLLVGTNAWYKNLDFAFSALLESGLQVVKVGDLNVKWLEKYPQNKLIHFEGVSDKELQWLYQNAKCLVFPSIREGFGWPVLEAMASGCHVLASNKANICEIAGEYVSYFDPYDDRKLKSLVANIFEEHGGKAKGIEKAREFNLLKFKNEFSI